MPKGAIEVVEFEPRQIVDEVMAGCRSSKSTGFRPWLWLENRSLASCAAALASLLLHAAFIAPALWASGAPPRHSPDRKYPGDTVMQWIVLDDSPPNASARPASPAAPTLVAMREERLPMWEWVCKSLAGY